MWVFVEYPIIMNIDNVGAIFLSENTSEYQWTKNTGSCHHFIYDYARDGTIKIKFVSSEENMAYPFTKNLSNGQFESLTSRYVKSE